MTHPRPNRRFVPQAVLTRSGKINTVGASVNIPVRPVNTTGSKPTMNHPIPISNAYKKGYLQVTRPFNKPQHAGFGKPKTVVHQILSRNIITLMHEKEYKEKGVIDSGCSRHMNGNKCYLTEYEDYDGGFVSSGDGKGRISGKVVTDDFSRFSWVFFLATKDETSGILKTFISEIENQLDYKVKVIRSDNETEFKNSVMNQFCEMKGIKREFSVARTPQQNGVPERRNRTLIEDC
ncbi:ribonuclease H-like domain-containing protein [Tanacetum coccineum]